MSNKQLLNDEYEYRDFTGDAPLLIDTEELRVEFTSSNSWYPSRYGHISQAVFRGLLEDIQQVGLMLKQEITKVDELVWEVYSQVYDNNTVVDAIIAYPNCRVILFVDSKWSYCYMESDSGYPYITRKSNDVNHIPSNEASSDEDWFNGINPYAIDQGWNHVCYVTDVNGENKCIVKNIANCEAVCNLEDYVTEYDSSLGGEYLEKYRGRDEVIIVPPKVSHIGIESFKGAQIRKIIIHSNVKCISLSAFANCSMLECVEMEAVEYIEDYAFSGCIKLRDVILASKLKSIGRKAFDGCCSLDYKSLHFGPNIQKIGSMAFSDVLNAPKLIIDSQRNIFLSCNDANIDKVTIPEGIKEIGEGAFYGCSQLEYVDLPNSVEKIGAFAFNGCKGLEKISLPPNVSVINTSTFSHSGLKEITIPEIVTQINQGAFSGCSLCDFTIHDSVEYIGAYAFSHCGKNTNIHIPSNAVRIDHIAFKGSTLEKDVELSQNLELLGNNAFEDCNGVEVMVFPDNYDKVPVEVCRNVASLRTVVIGVNTKRILNKAFRNCSNLANIIVKGDLAAVPVDSVLSLNKNLIIYGRPGTLAEQWAVKNNVHFMDLEIGLSRFSQDHFFKNEFELQDEGLSKIWEGKTFVATGDLRHFPEYTPYPQRKELKEFIEKRGGRLVGSISGKTDYLICNDVNSNTKKLLEAKERGISIISEDEFLNMGDGSKNSGI